MKTGLRRGRADLSWFCSRGGTNPWIGREVIQTRRGSSSSDGMPAQPDDSGSIGGRRLGRGRPSRKTARRADSLLVSRKSGSHGEVAAVCTSQECVGCSPAEGFDGRYAPGKEVSEAATWHELLNCL
ncbi:hypothetical protein V8C44DRAFT_164983 [Trichoderma aethiopicum]